MEEQPSKRRRLSPLSTLFATAHDTTSESLSRSPYSRGLEDVTDEYPYSHRLQGLTYDYPPRRRVDEVHVHIRNHSPDRRAARHYRRQTNLGTGVSSSSVLPTSGVSASASVVASAGASGDITTLSTGVSGSIQASETSSDSSATPGSTSTASASSSEELSSSSPAVTSSASALASTSQLSGTAISSTSTVSTGVTSLTNGSSSVISSGLGSTRSSTLSSAETGVSNSSVASTSLPTANASSLATSNGTLTAASSSTTSGTSRGLVPSSAAFGTSNSSSTISQLALSSSTASTTRSGNLTTSAVVFVGSQTTYTSFTTFNRISGSLTSTQPTTGVRTYTDYATTVATLSDGSFATLAEARLAVVTTLSNGDLTTSYGSFLPLSTESISSTSSSSSSSTDSSSSTLSTSSGATTATSTAATSTAASSSNGSGIAGGVATGTAAASASAASSSAASTTNDNTSNSTPPASVLAGGIVGGVAGLAVLVLVAMAFLRWYRRRAANMQPLTESEAARSAAGPVTPHGPGMAERAGLAPVLAPLLGGGVFKSRREAEAGAAPTGERGFQRVSGRKLPSAFSEGMEGPSIAAMPAAFSNGRDSTYRDSTYDGAGPFADPDGDVEETISQRAGPARQATLHAGGPYTALSPTVGSTFSNPASPTTPTFGQSMDGHLPPSSPPETANRSITPATMSSFEGSRGSRFTEEV